MEDYGLVGLNWAQILTGVLIIICARIILKRD